MANRKVAMLRWFRRRNSAVAAVCLLLGWLHQGAAAQPPPPTERPKLEGRIQYVGPDTYILLDSAGRGQPVLGMTYEEFMAAWKKSQTGESQVTEPRFTIDEVQVTGQAKEDHAELEVTVTVRLLARSAVEIPLGMAGGILGEQPDWDVVDGKAVRDGAGNIGSSAAPYVDFAPERGGFVAGLRGERDERHRITLRLLVPLVRDGNETSLSLNLPRALVSKMSLEVPTPIAGAAVNDGLLLSQEPSEPGGSRLTVTGMAGDFRLT